MPLHKIPNFYHHFIKYFSTTTSTSWRIQAQEHQLVSKISTILLQRHNWQSLLTTLNLSSKLTPQIFLQVLDKIQTNSEISLNFFNWAKKRSNLGLQPDLKTHCKIVQIVSGSGKARPITPILDCFIGVDPPTHVVYSMIQACKGSNLQSHAFSCIIESYAQKGFYYDGLVVYNNVVNYGYLPKVGCLNKLLDVLESVGEFRLAYCLYGSMFRNGVLPDMSTWTVIARVLYKSGKFESVVRLLDLGACSYEVFDLVIDGYSKNGDFGAAVSHLNEMCRRNVEPGFATYGAILDGACRYGNADMIDMVLCAMKEKKFIPEELSLGCDVVIRKFCDLGMMYAAELFFRRAQGEEVALKDATFGYILRGLCKGGKVDEAIGLYDVIRNENIVVKKSYYQELADSLCNAEPSKDLNQLLTHLIQRGFSPRESEISKFLIELARLDKWGEACGLLDVMLQAGLLPDSCCCRLFVEHYCSCGQVDAALSLHAKMEKSETLWDVTTYNVLLRALFIQKRVNEALSIFDCMVRKNVVNRASFLVMISQLSQEKQMRKAMQIHDQMLKLGLKPSSKTYKNLISVFR